MNKPIVDKIAAAVLYEGYILYPYRPSVKNRQRWTFGGVYPQAYSTAQGGAEPCFMQTQSLLEAGRDSRLEVRIRFLHLVNRQVGKITARVAGGEPEFQEVESLQVGSKRFQSWQEAVEREVALAETSLTDLLLQPRRHSFRFPGDRNLEPIRTPEGDTVAVIVREQQPLEGLMEWRAEAVDQGLYRMTVKISNETQMDHTWARDRDRALRHAFVSTHTVLGVENGEFISLMDPGRRQQAASACVNIGTWPILVGEEGVRDTLLSSPIILYDYPQVAPESPGDLFDATEIDEILSLRILTLTDDEKQEAAATDERARALLERTESLAREQLMGLHGAIRGLRPVREEVARD